MRYPVLLASAAGLLAAPALAADIGTVEPLPAPPAPPQYFAPAPAGDWTGLYLGVLGGYAWGKAGTDALGEVDVNGFDVGGYAGANWQIGTFVVGAEGDVILPFREETVGGLTVDQGLNGSLRARAGIALDNFLLYGTGGLAATGLELSSAAGSDDAVLWGWTAGAGVESQWLDNITARIEYRYTDYENQTFTLGGGTVDSDFSTHAIRGGLGLQF